MNVKFASGLANFTFTTYLVCNEHCAQTSVTWSSIIPQVHFTENVICMQINKWLYDAIKIKTLEEVHCAKWIWSKLKTNLILQVIIDHFPSNCILWHASGFESESHIHSTFKYNFPKTGHQDNVRTKNNLQQCIQLKRTWISWTVANIKISFLQWNCG